MDKKNLLASLPLGERLRLIPVGLWRAIPVPALGIVSSGASAMALFAMRGWLGFPGADPAPAPALALILSLLLFFVQSWGADWWRAPPAAGHAASSPRLRALLCGFAALPVLLCAGKAFGWHGQAALPIDGDHGSKIDGLWLGVEMGAAPLIALLLFKALQWRSHPGSGAVAASLPLRWIRAAAGRVEGFAAEHAIEDEAEWSRIEEAAVRRSAKRASTALDAVPKPRL